MEEKHVVEWESLDSSPVSVGSTSCFRVGRNVEEGHERLGSQMGGPNPDAKWVCQTLKAVGGWERKKGMDELQWMEKCPRCSGNRERRGEEKTQLEDWKQV